MLGGQGKRVEVWWWMKGFGGDKCVVPKSLGCGAQPEVNELEASMLCSNFSQKEKNSPLNVNLPSPGLPAFPRACFPDSHISESFFFLCQEAQ